MPDPPACQDWAGRPGRPAREGKPAGQRHETRDRPARRRRYPPRDDSRTLPLTRKRSQVQVLYRPPAKPQVRDLRLSPSRFGGLGIPYRFPGRGAGVPQLPRGAAAVALGSSCDRPPEARARVPGRLRLAPLVPGLANRAPDSFRVGPGVGLLQTSRHCSEARLPVRC